MIKKEVFLKASAEDVWQYLTDRNHISNLWNSGVDLRLEKGGIIKFHNTGETMKIIEMERPRLLSLYGGYGSLPITTTYELRGRKNKTILKITIGGWENLSQAEIKEYVPVLSFQWEERIFQIKKSLESIGRVKMKNGKVPAKS
jgi:uncharacterized protein YndB with AHSA1/START domain